MKISPNFDLRELVHPDIYHKVGNRCADFLNPNLVTTLEDIKALIGGESVTVNDWLWNGRYVDSGLRLPAYDIDEDKFRNLIENHNNGLLPLDELHDALKKEFLKYVMFTTHRMGNSADCKFKTISPKVVQELILSNPDDFPFISRIEDAAITKTWLHVEVSTEPRKGDIIIFKPRR